MEVGMKTQKIIVLVMVLVMMVSQIVNAEGETIK